MTPCEISLFRLNGSMHIGSVHYGFLCMLRGSVTLQSGHGNIVLQEHEAVYFAGGDVFDLQTSGGAILLILNWNSEFLLERLGTEAFDLSWSVFPVSSLSTRSLLSRLCRVTTACLDDQTQKKFYLSSACFDLLDWMYGKMLQNRPLPDPVPGCPEKSRPRIQKILRYLSDHADETVTLNDAAELAGWTPQYLSGFLKKQCGTTFSSLLTDIRLKNACLRLAYSEVSPKKVAGLSGFPNYEAFASALFQAEGSTPEEYRTAHRPGRTVFLSEGCEVIGSHALASDAIREYLPDFSPFQISVEENVEEKYAFSAQQTRRRRISWNRLINLGSGSDFRNYAFREQLRAMQNTLHFEYGRLQDILQLTQMFSGESGSEYVFQTVFSILDFLQDLGLRPFLSFSNKPFEASQAPVENVTYGGKEEYVLTEEDLAWADRQLGILPAFLSRSVDRYGPEAVSEWCFEIPILFSEDLNRSENVRQYMSRFRALQKAIHTVVPKARVGAPCFHTTLPMEKLDSYLREMKECPELPDFVSIIIYPHEHSSASEITKDPDFFHARVMAVRACMRKYGLEALPLYVSEFSAYVTYKHYINDSVFQASYILKQVLGSTGAVSGFGYWLTSDLSLQYRGSASILFGGNGLLSRDGLKKPGYYAMRFLQSLDENIIASGEHYIVTSDRNGRYHVLFHYYSHFSHDFRHHADKFTFLHSPRSAFVQAPPLSIRVALTEVAEGEWTIRRRCIGGGHGDLLQRWQEIGYPPSLRPDEIDYLDSQSRPSLQIESVKSAGTLEFHATLETNESILIEAEYRS
ncbi:MAG: helix-turn-helix domain-containing protein [Lachnospiraceae bacterium]|jgi:xylan 1,4-beta-xylosidase|nr:helix-turn-helix domain-containing protein [Lachnospiraceae bacterium]